MKLMSNHSRVLSSSTSHSSTFYSSSFSSSFSLPLHPAFPFPSFLPAIISLSCSFFFSLQSLNFIFLLIYFFTSSSDFSSSLSSTSSVSSAVLVLLPVRPLHYTTIPFYNLPGSALVTGHSNQEVSRWYFNADGISNKVNEVFWSSGDKQIYE